MVKRSQARPDKRVIYSRRKRWGSNLQHEYVPIERSFVLADEDYLRDPDQLEYFGHEPNGVFTWEKLLTRAPVVVLAEGRSGKTEEFRQQVKRLKANGHAAFLVPIERLHDECFDDALECDDQEAFQTWKDSSSAPGFFFLDAIDELKLRQGTLRRAIGKLNAACRPNLDRVRLFLSCRPADWEEQIDERALTPFLARASVPGGGETEVTGEDAFLEIIKATDARAGGETTQSEKDQKPPQAKLTVVTLLPLSQAKLRSFSERYAPEQVEGFLSSLEADNVWHLYRLPAEAIDGLDELRETGALGTLETQLETGIQRKLREQDPGKRNALSSDKAWLGAERVALALFLFKRRSIKVPAGGDKETLDISDILTDWTQAEQIELISKPLFDPSGVGSVRFHHRASQEYLAAKRLLGLLREDMPLGDVYALLFGDVGGLPVVKPSMAPVAAWLSLWNEHVRKEVLRREAKLLFRQGLPSAFSVDLRADILRAYVSDYAGKDWCSAGIGHPELRRVAHPELAPVVRELWDKGYTGHDSRELLLELIWLAPMPACVDLALAAVLDSHLDASHRRLAAWGVLAAGTQVQKQELAAAVVGRAVPEFVIRSCLFQMVPTLISTDAFLAVVDQMKQEPNDVHGLNYTIYETAKNGHLNAEDLVRIRDSLTDRVWTTRRDDAMMYQAHSEKDHYQDGLFALCAATIPAIGNNASTWVRAVVIAHHFGEQTESIIAKAEQTAVQNALAERSDLREAYCWASVATTDALEGDQKDSLRAFDAIRRLLQFARLNKDDQEWLLEATRPGANEGHRAVAFFILFQAYDLRAEKPLATQLEHAIQDRADLVGELDAHLNPKARETDKYEVKQKRQEQEFARKEEKRIEGWVIWRTRLLNDPDFLMAGDERESVLRNAYRVMDFRRARFGGWGHWDSDVLKRCFGEDFLVCFRRELVAHWRQTEVQLFSERDAEKRNTYPVAWMLALTGVKAESELPGWASALTPEEAAKAARIAYIELNGFADYLVDLETSHPRAVADVISGELQAQLEAQQELGRVPILQDIHYHGSRHLKAVVTRLITPELPTLMSCSTGGAENALSHAVSILAEAGSDADKQAAIEILIAVLKRKGTQPLSTSLGLLSRLDPEKACHALLEATESLDTPEQTVTALSCFAAMFGDRFEGAPTDLGKIADSRRVDLLHKLTLRAYQAVPYADDIQHGGEVTERHQAQNARSFLFDQLTKERQPQVLAALHDLATRAEFAHKSDRLREIARECAAHICDEAVYALSAFQEMDRERAFHPVDESTLLRSMLTRLQAFEHDLLYAEHSPVEVLRRASNETELRRSITHYLERADQGVYKFTQEAVSKDEKRTDIRFHPRMMNGYGTVELKREDWSVAQLEEALRDQLVGRYLNHDACRVGILLICQSKKKPKGWQHPDTGEWLQLDRLVTHLSAIAEELMIANPKLHLAVKGINYSAAE